MQPQFWLERWQARQIGFHEGAPNRYLVHYAPTVLTGASHVLVPLCGKAVDLIFLHQQGHRVTGVELSAQAVQEFASDNALTAHTQQDGSICWHRFDELPQLQIAVGDFFDPRWSEVAGLFDAVYDRAALVALPGDLRARYGTRICSLTRPGARMLLISREHDTGGGPPFSVPEHEILQHYGQHWDLSVLERQNGQDNAGLKVDVVYRAQRRP